MYIQKKLFIVFLIPACIFFSSGVAEAKTLSEVKAESYNLISAIEALKSIVISQNLSPVLQNEFLKRAAAIEEAIDRYRMSEIQKIAGYEIAKAKRQHGSESSNVLINEIPLSVDRLFTDIKNKKAIYENTCDRAEEAEDYFCYYKTERWRILENEYQNNLRNFVIDIELEHAKWTLAQQSANPLFYSTADRGYRNRQSDVCVFLSLEKTVTLPQAYCAIWFLTGV